MGPELIYWAMCAAFLAHELDAVRRHEWRILPILRSLPDRWGEEAFVWLHVPLFLVMLWFSNATSFRQGLAVFAVVHVGLHWLLRRHRACEFNNASSWSLILLTGALGAAYLAAARA